MNIFVALGVFFLGLVVSVAWGGQFRVDKNDKAAQITAGSVFALLGFLIVFSLTSAWSQHEARFKLSVDEANALSTAANRVELVAPEGRESLAKAMLKYTRERVSYNEKLVELEMPRLSPLDEQGLWRAAAEAVKESKGSDVARLLLEPLDRAIALAGERDAEMKNPLPPLLLVLVAAVSLVAAFLMGRHGTGDRTALREGLVFAGLIVLASYAILDLAGARTSPAPFKPTDDRMQMVVLRLEGLAGDFKL